MRERVRIKNWRIEGDRFSFLSTKEVDDVLLLHTWIGLVVLVFSLLAGYISVLI
jgi:hypothetical protein